VRFIIIFFFPIYRYVLLRNLTERASGGRKPLAAYSFIIIIIIMLYCPQNFFLSVKRVQTRMNKI